MMHGSEKSDSSVLAKKSANKTGQPEAESMERREGAEENAERSLTSRTQSREILFGRLDRVRQAARGKKKERFTALLHHVSVELLGQAYHCLKRNAAPGVDGVTWHTYGECLEEKLIDLHRRIHSGSYQPLPSKRKYIEKADGRKRPLGMAALEDKIAQRAVVEVLNAIYEQDFLGFSYGFRPGRGQHDALDALAVGITQRKVNWILDADIAAFFDTVSQDWMMRFLEHRIGDSRLLRLIGKWLKAGVLEDGQVTVTDMGTPQGSVISPTLANIYLHYVFDLWAHRWRQHKASGAVILVRYADDTVAGFAHEGEAKCFLGELQQRMGKFALRLHPDKTRLIEFGRFAAERRAKRGLGKPETFNFLGLTHIAGHTRKGRFLLIRRTRSDRMRAKLHAVKEELRRRMHESIIQQGQWLRQVVRGYLAYHAVPTNYQRLSAFRYCVMRLWLRVLRSRSQRHRFTWDRMAQLAAEWLPTPRILHPWPEARFAVNHPR
jgi:RNA-directed DNA polymerase